MKTCTKCGLQKALEQFSRLSTAPDGKQYYCKACNKAWRAEYHRLNCEKIAKRRRWEHIRLKYGLSQQQYEEQLARQGGVCAICRTSEPGGRGNVFTVDHDHSCCPSDRTCGNCMRGLLCDSCNTGLGRFRDDPKLVMEAALYLRSAERDQGIQRSKAVA